MFLSPLNIFAYGHKQVKVSNQFKKKEVFIKIIIKRIKQMNRKDREEFLNHINCFDIADFVDEYYSGNPKYLDKYTKEQIKVMEEMFVY